MKRLLALLGTLIFVAASAAGVGADDLWNLAVSHYESFGDLLPGRMTIRFDQYNGRGRLVSSEYSEIELEVGPDGELTSRTVLAVKDGEDVTSDRRDPGSTGPPFGGGGDEDGDSPFAGLTLSPFDPEEQPRVTVTDTGRVERFRDTTARVLHYRHTTGEEAGTVGTVWLDTQTGAPLRLVAEIEPLPGYVKEFEMVQAFETDGEGRWHLARMEFIGEGNILFLRRRIESEFEFSDYFLPPEGTIN